MMNKLNLEKLTENNKLGIRKLLVNLVHLQQPIVKFGQTLQNIENMLRLKLKTLQVISHGLLPDMLQLMKW